ncbi:hypothetical protein ACWGCW_12035 [Streptomyces sp. NPDC054933]
MKPPPLPRWTGPVYLVLSAVLLPWIVYLALTLPQRQLSDHYRMAWVGFDVFLLGQLARTGLYALRERWRTKVTHHAASSATLLCVDAWFDTTTSTSHDRPLAITLALLIELPLAALCWWLATGHADIGVLRLNDPGAEIIRQDQAGPQVSQTTGPRSGRR